MKPVRMNLVGKTVALTGGGGGLGSDLARSLRSRGANVALIDLTPEMVDGLADELGGGHHARGWGVDVRDFEAQQEVFDEVADHFGRIDVVVAGAGVLGPLQTIGPTDPADWDRVIDINLNGVWRTLKAAAPHIQETRGHMVAVSSMIAYVHPPLLASYAASKAGVAAMADALRLEMRPVGVTVGTVHPAIFRTALIGDALSSPAAVALVKDFTGVFKTVELSTVVSETVRGIERRSKRVVVPRMHRSTAFVPGVAQAAIERLLFRRRDVDRAIELGSETSTPSEPQPIAKD